MGKTAKRLKRKQSQPTPELSKKFKTNHPALTPSASDTDSTTDNHEGKRAKSLDDIVSQDVLDIMVETLTSLNENPALIKQQRLKDLRRAVFTFSRIANGGNNIPAASKSAPVTTSSLTARVSAALTASDWTEARVVLSEMRIRKMTPKLGALQRWVRECDAISGVSATTTTVDAENSKDIMDNKGNHLAVKNEVMRVLDAILRVADSTVRDIDCEDLSVIRHPDWDPRDKTVTPEPIHKISEDRSTFLVNDTPPSQKFRPILITPGPERKPANLHPAILYASTDNAIPLSPTSTMVTKTPHPHIPSINLLRNVLSTTECNSIVQTCTQVGFLPDAPIGTLGTESSTLAHNVYWLTDNAFIDTLFNRVQPALQTIAESLPGTYGKLTGLNRRFRVYRYVPGALYRPHLDGAWPPSGTDAKSGSYVYDTSQGKQSSRLTFLVYLNDEFNGGQTTFFRPNKVRDGVLDAHGVKPVVGGALVFPHGDAEGALLHEGSGVLEDGAKYIIRTDVLFEI